ncbi:hydantoinase B/oxoprolinase family protein [Nocardia xishanensis]|uniref:Hydantoinase B/oxoprolinase family protein n=1 Tax=Nocardia xishanensis TaxID=238964 RepID=A0ABW7X9N3_9NOCA
MATDVITLEVLRSRLESLATEAGRAIGRTAISPVVVEAGDFSATILDRDGRLIAGGGKIKHHFRAAMNFIDGIVARHSGTIIEGDIFFANDPHNGGGLHAQDVFIGRPVVVGGEVVAWVASSAHMMDMGGSVPGSFAPAATECYAEAFRTPAVRLARGGVEQTDVWAILKNNIRLSALVEMDIRGLLAGVNVAHDELVTVIAEFGPECFSEAVDELRSRTAAELRRRIEGLERGRYKSTSWVEWGDDLFKLVCELRVGHGRLLFDFSGTDPQTRHFFNTKSYILEALLGVDLMDYLAPELPYNGGLFDVIKLICPEGSLVNCLPPAPVGAPHIYAGSRCSELAVTTLLMAVAASEGTELRCLQNAGSVGSAAPIVTWAGPGRGGSMDGWLMLDGAASGAPAALDRDGSDYLFVTVGQETVLEFQDIEITESWYPLRFEYKKARSSLGGAGTHRAGFGVEMAYRVDGSPGLVGVMLGNRGRLPVPGAAGGLPGSLLAYDIRRADGSVERLGVLEESVALTPDDIFVLQSPTAGGWGDPLDRDPGLVEDDVARGVLDRSEAASLYGVVLGESAATEALRQQMLADRLKSAAAPAQLDGRVLSSGRHGAPLCPGVEQRGDLAVSIRSGAVLATAPRHWTEGCPVLTQKIEGAAGVSTRAYLDPVTGHYLYVEVAPDGVERSFACVPDRWANAG